MYLQVDPAAATAAPADAKVRAALQSIRSRHAALPVPPEAGRRVGRTDS